MARRQKQRPRRKYDDEFKRDVVAMVRAGQSVAEVSRNLDLTASAVRTWVDRADPPEDDPIADKDKAELARLRAENKQLRQERDILAKATAFFAKEST